MFVSTLSLKGFERSALRAVQAGLCRLPVSSAQRPSLRRAYTTNAEEDPYKELGLDRNATPEQIKQAYLRASKRYHPDVNPSKDAEIKFIRASNSYAVLRDPWKKRTYDTKWSAEQDMKYSTRSSQRGPTYEWAPPPPPKPETAYTRTSYKEKYTETSSQTSKGNKTRVKFEYETEQTTSTHRRWTEEQKENARRRREERKKQMDTLDVILHVIIIVVSVVIKVFIEVMKGGRFVAAKKDTSRRSWLSSLSLSFNPL